MLDRFLSLLLALLLCLPFSPAQAEAPHTTTVMVYMCGSNLESQYGLATRDITEMIQASFTPRITNVVLMTGGSSQWLDQRINPEASGIYELRGNTLHPLWEGERRNMADSSTLSFFLDTVHAKYNTDRYMLIFWNHGGGPIKGVCWDENYNKDSLTIPEMVDGLSNSPFAERKLDMIGFDACLMGSVETAWQLSEYAHYMVASEETEPGSGWHYDFLRGMEYDASPVDTARRIIDLYIDSADPAQGHNLTLSCIDLAKMQDVVHHMDLFFADLNGLLDERMFLDMSSLRHYAQGFGRDFRAEETADYDLVDMTSLLDSFDKYQLTSGQRLRSALQQAIVYSRSTHANSYGLSVYFPYFNLGSYAASGLDMYKTLDFCPGYAAYIQNFKDFMTGDAAIDWRGLAPTVSRTDDGFEVSLQLTQAQQDNLVSAKLVIFESDFAPGSSNSFYRQVYGTADVHLTGSGLITAPYHDESMVIHYTTEEGINAFSDPLAFLLLDNGSYNLQVMAANLKPDYVSAAKDDEPGVSHLMQFNLSPADENDEMHILSVQAYDSMTNAFTPRTDDSPEKYKYLHFVSRPRLMTRRDGLLLPYELWQQDDENAATLYSNFSMPTDSEMSVLIQQKASGLRYAAFEITDTQNNTFTTELTMIRPLAEVTLSQRTFTLPEPPLDIRCRLMATSAHSVSLLIEVVNHSHQPYAFSLSEITLNGMVQPRDGAAAITWPVAAQQSASVPLSFDIMDTQYDDVITGVLSSINLSISLYDGATGAYLGDLAGLSLKPNVSLFALPAIFK